MKQHIAFYIPQNTDKDRLIQQIINCGIADYNLGINHLNGEIFSNKTLQYFIDEEIRHDQYKITAGKNNMLSRSSGGEQRIALLNHIIAQKPAYIIIDNVFESLDTDHRQSILARLKELSAGTLFIQLFSRKNELLPFINTVYMMGENLLITRLNRDDFNRQHLNNLHFFSGSIPPPVAPYQPQSNPLVKMHNICVQYNGTPVLQNICWEINTGEFWQLSGPNGSGKSTLLSLITGNSPKGYGQELYLFGHKKGSGETVWDIKQKTGYFTPVMTQQFDRLDSVEKMIISGFYDSVGLYIKPTDRQEQLAREWLMLLSMLKEKNKPFCSLPEGSQRMVLIARAMVKHPPLLILDEPTTGLDDDMAELFTQLINKIASESNTAILYVSHKEEPGLTPEKIFKLTATENGSTGQVV